MVAIGWHVYYNGINDYIGGADKFQYVTQCFGKFKYVL